MFIVVEYIKTESSGIHKFLVDSPQELSEILHEILNNTEVYYMVSVDGHTIQEDYLGFGKFKGWIPKGYNPFTYLRLIEHEKKREEDMFNKAIKDGVELYKNDEQGYIVYSIVVDGEYWLDSFIKFKDAMTFIQEHGFNIHSRNF